MKNQNSFFRRYFTLAQLCCGPAALALRGKQLAAFLASATASHSRFECTTTYTFASTVFAKVKSHPEMAQAPKFRFGAGIYTAVLSAAVMVAMPALALNEVKSIEISGIQRVERETVMSYLPLQLGDEYSPRVASEMVKVLYGTGLFDNVAVDWKDGKLLIEVKENPMVNRVVFEGNEEFDKDRLLEMVSLKPRTVYTPGKVQEDVREIMAAYRNSGFFMAKITPQLIRRDQNRVDLIFKIEEGEATKVNRIRFVGNRAFGDADLRRIVGTRESRWWRFLSASDNYDPDRIEFDKELMRRFYISKGYADVQINSAVAELTRDKQGFFITYTVNEGAQYTFGKITASLNQEEFEVKPEELMSVVT
jgi:outer membrane protein insertion porin family